MLAIRLFMTVFSFWNAYEEPGLLRAAWLICGLIWFGATLLSVL